MNAVLREHLLENGSRLQLVRGDITIEAVDAIVNAANTYLSHGGGLAGALVRRGGESIQHESDAWVQAHGLVSHSHPAWTGAGTLPARYILHAVGPVWGDGDEDSRLSSAIHGSLRLADELGIKSIALPAISTGIFGFPKLRAAGVIYRAITQYFKETTGSGLEFVRLVLFDQPGIDAFLEVWQDLQL